MGKQINYYIEYEDFLSIAEKALKNGCEIIKKVDKKFIRSRDISIVTRDCYDYYFYLPEAGELIIENNEVGGEYFSFEGLNVLIEAGYSRINEDEKVILRNRLYIITGYYNDKDEWISRQECIEKVYNRLAYSVRKMTVRYYATERMLELVREGYSLR